MWESCTKKEELRVTLSRYPAHKYELHNAQLQTILFMDIENVIFVFLVRCMQATAIKNSMVHRNLKFHCTLCA